MTEKRNIQDMQNLIAKFNEARGWGKTSKYDSAFLKDFLLNMIEEVGEVWHIIKWVDGETQKELVEKHKAEFEDFVGDQLYLILKIAYLLDIDSEKALQNTLDEYEKRFSVDNMDNVKHGNPYAGGIDNKENLEN